VATIQTNRLLCADNETVQLVGRDVPEERITVVYPSGCSVTVKMIVVTVRTNYPITVLNVSHRRTSSAKTTGVYQKDGCAILKTIVVITPTNLKICVKDCIDSVRNPNSNVRTGNAYQVNGDATTMTIAETIQTNSIVEVSNVKTVLSNVRVAIASHHTSVVTAIETAETLVMKSDVRRGIPMVGIVQSPNSNAKLPNYVYLILRSAMVKTIAETALTKFLNCVVRFIFILFTFYYRYILNIIYSYYLTTTL